MCLWKNKKSPNFPGKINELMKQYAKNDRNLGIAIQTLQYTSQYTVMKDYSNGSLNLFVKRIKLIVAFKMLVLTFRVNRGFPKTDIGNTRGTFGKTI